MEFVFWLLKVAKFSFADLEKKLRIDISTVKENIQALFDGVLAPTFAKVTRKHDSLRKMLVCKEDKEQLTKAKIRLLTQLYLLINSLDEESLEMLCDGMRITAGGLQTLSLQIILVPVSH